MCRFQVRVPKYIQLGLTAMSYEVSYDRSYTTYGYSWAWFSLCSERYAFGTPYSVSCVATSLTLLSATPALTVYMR
jgi:hypothetical protein